MLKELELYEDSLYNSGFPSDYEVVDIDTVYLHESKALGGKEQGELLLDALKRGMFKSSYDLNIYKDDYLSLTGNCINEVSTPNCIPYVLNEFCKHISSYFKNMGCLYNENCDDLYNCLHINIWDDVNGMVNIQINSGSVRDGKLFFTYPLQEFLSRDFRNLTVVEKDYGITEKFILDMSPLLLTCVRSAINTCFSINEDIVLGQVTLIKKGDCFNPCNSQGFLGLSLAPAKGGDSYLDDEVIYDDNIQVYYIM